MAGLIKQIAKFVHGGGRGDGGGEGRKTEGWRWSGMEDGGERGEGIVGKDTERGGELGDGRGGRREEREDGEERKGRKGDGKGWRRGK